MITIILVYKSPKIKNNINFRYKFKKSIITSKFNLKSFELET
jgi:hypothetical protein